MRILNPTKVATLGLFCLLLGLLAGCSTTTPTAKKVYFFFPPPPDEARIQFLTAFSTEKEFRGGEVTSLMSYLTGAKPADKDLSKPYGEAVYDKKLFVCDTELSAVVVADFRTRNFGTLEAQGEGMLKKPLNLTFDSDGNCYVADSGREQVVIFDKARNYLAAIGKTGELKPRDVAVSKDRIYVADLQKHSVKVFDKASREPLFSIPRKEDETNDVRRIFTPTNLALDSKGRIYVSDTGAFRIQVYDSDGKYLRAVGEMGDRVGQFSRVKGIAIDHADRLYAVDALSGAIQIFDDSGRMLTWFTEPDTSSKSQNLPTKVAVDYEDVAYFQSYAAPGFKVEHLILVINQIGSHKVSVYGFGHKQ